ncbi:TetR/AcrR family transcriptional regulator [Mycobacterium sp. NAZ190054]|uniref:TetR/AcrR family transcriptional regulator n=1 Tax=Mycobacterium sp. NAZ190054 TaxID=1747766 RepID=UPI00079C0EDE|nr:TetR/AcrR family transcriptional regulator [Mycobacterium sp. NAZ190054]KWX57461.1 TetR family transcriptional regulator [Mycobacterium sp. NAZ190054]
MSVDGQPGEEGPLPRALELLWRDAGEPRSGGLNRRRIVDVAIELADADGLGALSMARLAERLGCGTMSLYRHVANKDELLTFMVSAAPGPPPPRASGAHWRDALTEWAHGLRDAYHRHPWILQASVVPPVDPGQLAWLDGGLAAMDGTGLSDRDKFSAVMAILHFVRGAAALDLETADRGAAAGYPALLRRLVTTDRFPALAAAVRAGVFDTADDRQADFRSGLHRFLDGIAAEMARPR